MGGIFDFARFFLVISPKKRQIYRNRIFFGKKTVQYLWIVLYSRSSITTKQLAKFIGRDDIIRSEISDPVSEIILPLDSLEMFLHFLKKLKGIRFSVSAVGFGLIKRRLKFLVLKIY